MTTFASNGGLSGSENSPRDYVGMIISNKNSTQTVAAAKTIAGWGTLINPATTAAIKALYISGKEGFEDKTKATEYTEGVSGAMFQTNNFAPAFYMYGEMTEQDYDSFKPFNRMKIDVRLVRDDFKIVTCLNSAGLEKGFAAKLFIETPIVKPGGGEKLKAYPFYIVIEYWEEWNAKVTIQPSFLLPELEALTPIGIDIEVLTPYEASGKTVVVRATYRGSKTNANPTGTPATMFVAAAAADWELVSHGDTGGAISTETMPTAGNYTLTVVNTAAAMTSPFVIRGAKIESSHVTYLTNMLRIVTP